MMSLTNTFKISKKMFSNRKLSSTKFKLHQSFSSRQIHDKEETNSQNSKSIKSRKNSMDKY